jgi:general nucleoside transport system ATP-binding protein
VKPMLAEQHAPGPVRLQIDGLRAQGDRGRECLCGVSLDVRGGEIMGVAGVSGNGQRELAQCLAGLRPVTAGQVALDGQDITHAHVRGRLAAGQAFIPEERMRDGGIRDFSVLENAFLQDHTAPQFTRGIFMDFKAMETHARDLVKRFNIKTPSLETPLKNLSGGNIQKLIMARELARQPKVLIAAQPTRGVDIGATEYIHQRLLEQRGNGTAILLISEDLDEIQALSDRIAVMYEGRIMGVFNRGEASPEMLGLLMAGVVEGARDGHSS